MVIAFLNSGNVFKSNESARKEINVFSKIVSGETKIEIKGITAAIETNSAKAHTIIRKVRAIVWYFLFSSKVFHKFFKTEIIDLFFINHYLQESFLFLLRDSLYQPSLELDH